MPELPEVRTVASTLKKQMLNKKITDIKILYSGIIHKDSLDLNKIIGKSLIDIRTIGKYLIFDYGAYLLLSHLRMEGKYFIKSTDDEIVRHEHIIFEFGSVSLRYHDTRKFGTMLLIKAEDLSKTASVTKLAPEPFDEKMTDQFLYEKVYKSNLAIKTLILDQTIMNGLGNIYVDEVLFESKILPQRKGKEINLLECQKIIDNSRTILNNAIIHKGTTIRTYTSSLGVRGEYQNYLQVHQRANKPCYVCNDTIIKTVVGGRGTYYCPTCQK